MLTVEMKVPWNESSWERKFHITFVPRNESSRERKFQRAKVPSMKLSFPGVKVRRNESSIIQNSRQIVVINYLFSVNFRDK